MYLCIDKDIPFLSLENMTGMLSCFFFNVNIQYILSFIDDFYLRLDFNYFSLSSSYMPITNVTLFPMEILSEKEWITSAIMQRR